LPSSKLIHSGKRDTLLKLHVGVCSPSEHPALGLEGESNLEVFRDVRFGPNSGSSVIRVDLGAFLDSRPSEESIVTDERSDITVGDHERDGDLKHGSEEGHGVLEEVVGDLHDSGSVLTGRQSGPVIAQGYRGLT